MAVSVSTTEATTSTVSEPAVHFNVHGLINGAPIDHVRLFDSADGAHQANVHTRFLTSDDSGDDEGDEGSDCGGEHGDDALPTAPPAAKIARCRQRTIRSKEVWMYEEHKDTPPLPKRRKRYISCSSSDEGTVTDDRAASKENDRETTAGGARSPRC